MVLQVGEMIKELALSRQAEQSGRNQYQPIAGTVSQQPIQIRSSQPAEGRSFRPRTEVICFSCGVQGHRVPECRSMNPLPKEEQDRLRAMYARPNQQYLVTRLHSVKLVFPHVTILHSGMMGFSGVLKSTLMQE